MMKRIYLLLMAAIVSLAMPFELHANPSVEIIENDVQQNITITLIESTLHVTGASGEMLHIYNVAGVRVMSVRIEGADKRIELGLPKGCYIVEVGKVVRKISVK